VDTPIDLLDLVFRRRTLVGICDTGGAYCWTGADGNFDETVVTGFGSGTIVGRAPQAPVHLRVDATGEETGEQEAHCHEVVATAEGALINVLNRD
jgi:hypothetical protein